MNVSVPHKFNKFNLSSKVISYQNFGQLRVKNRIKLKKGDTINFEVKPEIQTGTFNFPFFGNFFIDYNAFKVDNRTLLRWYEYFESGTPYVAGDQDSSVDPEISMRAFPGRLSCRQLKNE